MKWRPISEFKIKGVPWEDGYDYKCLLWGGSVFVGYPILDYNEDGTPSIRYWLSYDMFSCEPTHFMPLPAGPEEE